MMFPLRTVALVGLSASLALAQRNITVTNTDPSITYEGENIGDAPICQKDSNGNVIGGQGGCYNFAEPCTESVTMGRGSDNAASFTFKGSAVYINSALYEFSPLYTVTLDGQTEDVDGFRESRPLTCQPLFSRTGLDPTIDHTITLAVKGPSPQANITEDSGSFASFFSLIDFTYTVEGSENSTSSSSAASGSSSTTSGTPQSASSSGSGVPSSPSNTADESEGAGVALSVPVQVTWGAVLALAQVLL